MQQRIAFTLAIPARRTLGIAGSLQIRYHGAINIPDNTSIMPRRQTVVATLALLLLCPGWIASAPAQTNDFSGATDDSIRNVITVVGNHQLVALADPAGNYAPAFTLAAAQSGTNRPAGVQWEYAWGVTLYGLLRAAEATGNTNLESFVLQHNLIASRQYGWLNSLKSTITNATAAQINSLLTSSTYNPALYRFFVLDRLDYCGAMTSQLLEGALNHSSGLTSQQAFVAQTTANWIAGGGQARLPDGTLWRPERDSTIWADDLYMSCPFLLRWYQYAGRTNYLDDAARQVINMAGYLQDTNGLWYHGYYTNSHSVNGYKWCRANGWAMVAATEVLSVMPTNHPARSNLLQILTRHIEGVKSVQAPSGRWRQLLDRPELWEETSSTAMFAYCIARAVNRGWIDPTNLAVARKGFVGLCENIATNGVIYGTCEGTSLSTVYSYYVNLVHTNADERHGRGPVLLAGSEILSHPRLNIALTANQVVVDWSGAIPANWFETSTNLAEWVAFPGPVTVSSNGQEIVTDDISGQRFYRLHQPPPAYPPAPLEFEAESLSRVTNGAAAAVSALDTNASGGFFVTLFGDSPGDYAEFTLTNVAAGAYRLKMPFQAGNNRARLNLTVDGNPLGAALDQYWPTPLYPLVDFGPVQLVTNGDHVLRLTVAGKSVASTNYTITADKFMLFRQ
jgi:unsaturated rhamnogalacturonyl hydrolase